jgi:hypothetical protein
VSGVGDDVNPCSRTAPCKTFPGAISKTAAGGIINCLDPGGFGAVTILKSITIDCTGTFGGILAAGTNGVNVNAAGIIVVLRGLSIEGVGTGQSGVNILAAGSVRIEDSHIYGFRSNTAAGIRVATTAATELNVINTTVSDNGIGTTTGGGIVVAPTGAAGSATVGLENVRATNNSVGIVANAAGSTNATGVRVTVANSLVSGNAGRGISALSGAAAATAAMMLSRVSVIGNQTGGLLADSANGVILVGSSVITQNLGAAAVTTTNGGTINSYQDNQFNNNPGGQGAFTGTVNLQ